jgi:hypothetical protein
MDVSSQFRAPAALLQGKETPGTHWIGAWVGLRIGQDMMVKIKISAPIGNRTAVLQPVATHYINRAAVHTMSVLKYDWLRRCFSRNGIIYLYINTINIVKLAVSYGKNRNFQYFFFSEVH